MGIHFVYEKTARNLKSFLRKHASEAERCMIIGDRIREEITLGNRLGMQTPIWARYGRFPNEPPDDATQTPTYIVDSIAELQTLLQRLRM